MFRHASQCDHADAVVSSDAIDAHARSESRGGAFDLRLDGANELFERARCEANVAEGVATGGVRAHVMRISDPPLATGLRDRTR